jgi:trans-aconitate methyltransferase
VSSVTTYWERRYREGKRGSGPGSCGAEAERKAVFVNALIAERHVNRVVDWGCGDGVIAAMLHCRRYVGIDVSPTALALCEERVRLPRRTWVQFDGWKTPDLPPAQLALSLDVIFHLTEERYYRRHLRLLFGSAPLVCIHSSNVDEEGEAHVLHREFLPDVPKGWEILHRPAGERDIGFWVFREVAT